MVYYKDGERQSGYFSLLDFVQNEQNLILNSIILESRREELLTSMKEELEAQKTPKHNLQTLEFKGLHLKMTHKQLRKLIFTTDWRKMFEVDNTVMLMADYDGSSEDFKILGCEGSENHKTCYYWMRSFVTFQEGKIYRIRIVGEKYTAEKIESKVIPRLKFVSFALETKYGASEKTFLDIDSINIFSFQEGFDVFVKKWIVDDQSITLAISTEENYFRGDIIYTDMKAEIKLEKESKKTVNF